MQTLFWRIPARPAETTRDVVDAKFSACCADNILNEETTNRANCTIFVAALWPLMYNLHSQIDLLYPADVAIVVPGFLFAVLLTQFATQAAFNRLPSRTRQRTG
jgi:hypothetical protein